MGRHHKPRRDRLGGGRSGDLGRYMYVSVGVWGGVVDLAGGDGGEGGGGWLLLYIQTTLQRK